MRRSLALIALALWPALVVAAPCTWRDDPTGSAFATPGRSALYSRGFTCPGDAQGRYTLRFDAILGKTRRTVTTKKGEVKPRGRWPRMTDLSEPLAPSQTCDFEFPPATPGALAPDNDGVSTEPATSVKVEAVFEGEGDLAALSRTEHAVIECPICPRPSSVGLIGIYEGRAMASRLSPGVRLKATATEPWFECARQGATLSVRYFVGENDKTVGRAIRPTFEQAGLEKLFRVRGEEAVFDAAVPIERLCRGVRGTRTVAWEAVGVGLLSELGGGGRSYHEVRCP